MPKLAENPNATAEQEKCFHCGLTIDNQIVSFDDKQFCCQGCKEVYHLLAQNDLCQYYSIEAHAGISPNLDLEKWAYLDSPEVITELLDFQQDDFAKVRFHVPQVHCSSCIFLLENLHKFRAGIQRSTINFPRKEVSVSFNPQTISLKDIVVLLASIGYEPSITLQSMSAKKPKNSQKRILYQLGMAGFAFGNIMLLSFPEYFADAATIQAELGQLFNIVSLILATPVFLYSDQDYFISAYHALRKRMLNIDVPISLGILVLYFYSIYQIFGLQTGSYLDSFTGLVFFLLIGKLFQRKTYETLSFERDYKSYFPISVSRKNTDNQYVTSPVTQIQKNDHILIRNQELVPADSILLGGAAFIDYSFVTGESAPVAKKTGDLIYAGGRQVGESIELEVVKEVSQSYLTQLWNNEAFQKIQDSKIETLSNRFSYYFTPIILLISFGTFLFWLPQSFETAIYTFCSVLIVACPCASALASPFTLGNAIRILGKRHFYLKNTSVIESLARTNAFVFDKTGTLTDMQKAQVSYTGITLQNIDKQLVTRVLQNSLHPLSQKIADFLASPIGEGRGGGISHFQEIAGKGIEAKIGETLIRLGSQKWVAPEIEILEKSPKTRVFLSIDGQYIGYFTVENVYRAGIKNLIEKLKKTNRLFVLSGDNSSEKDNLEQMFGKESQMCFGQTPQDKMLFIKTLQEKKLHTAMLGDGLNDAGALQQSQVGIAVTDNITHFTPASDAILEAAELPNLDRFVRFAKISVRIVIAGLAISMLYNVVGLSFAVQGKLAPIVCAVLMPLSSVTVVVFSTLMNNFWAKKIGI